MSKRLKLGFAVLIILIAFAFIAAPESQAKPASPFPFKVTQSDGTTIKLYRRGDEFGNWVETAEGQRMIKNEDTGDWEADVSEDDAAPLLGARRTYPGEILATGAEIGGVSGRAASRTRNVWTPRPIAGEYKVLVVRVEFSDCKFSAAADEELYKDQVFGDANSVKKYFLDQSLGKLKIVPAIEEQVITVTIENHPYPEGFTDAFEDEDELHEHEAAFVTEVLAELEKEGVSLSGFDTNPKDGYVTPEELCLYMILAGYEEANSDPDDKPSVWAHAWNSDESKGNEFIVKAGGIVLTDWAMQGELIYHDLEDLPQQMGTIAHELGHQLCRLPDLYDVAETKPNAGLGSFSLMDLGCDGTEEDGIPGSSPVNLDAWSRQYLGWEKPRQPANGPVTFTTPRIGNGTGSVKLTSRGHRNTQYFLAEVRDFSGWDAGLEGLFTSVFIPEEFNGGLLIIHVDDAVGSGILEEGNDINSSESNLHQGVMAVDASQPQSRGKGSTPYTLWWGENDRIREEAQSGASGRRTVDFMEPDSNFYGNISTGISIRGLGSVEKGTMTATVTRPASGGSGGCNSGAVSVIIALALIACRIYATRRRTVTKFLERG